MVKVIKHTFNVVMLSLCLHASVAAAQPDISQPIFQPISEVKTNKKKTIINLDDLRILHKCNTWQKYFDARSTRQTIGWVSLGVAGGVGLAWLLHPRALSTSASQDVSENVSKKNLEDLKLEKLLLDLEERRARSSFIGRLKWDVQHGVDVAIYTVVGGAIMYYLSSSGNFIWNKLKQLAGQGDDQVFKALSHELLDNLTFSMRSLTTFLQTSFGQDDNDKIQVRLQTEMAYGVAIDNVAFVNSFEEILAFMKQAIKVYGLVDEQLAEMDMMLNSITDLTRDFLARQESIFLDACDGKRHPQTSSLVVLTQGFYSQLMRCLGTVGTELYGKEFTLKEDTKK